MSKNNIKVIYQGHSAAIESCLKSAIEGVCLGHSFSLEWVRTINKQDTTEAVSKSKEGKCIVMVERTDLGLSSYFQKKPLPNGFEIEFVSHRTDNQALDVAEKIIRGWRQRMES